MKTNQLHKTTHEEESNKSPSNRHVPGSHQRPRHVASSRLEASSASRSSGPALRSSACESPALAGAGGASPELPIRGPLPTSISALSLARILLLTLSSTHFAMKSASRCRLSSTFLSPRIFFAGRFLGVASARNVAQDRTATREASCEAVALEILARGAGPHDGPHHCRLLLDLDLLWAEAGGLELLAIRLRPPSHATRGTQWTRRADASTQRSERPALPQHSFAELDASSPCPQGPSSARTLCASPSRPRNGSEARPRAPRAMAPLRAGPALRRPSGPRARPSPHAPAASSSKSCPPPS